jgi:hypothetical protein
MAAILANLGITRLRAHISAMKKRAKETDEEAHRRLRLIAIRYRLGIECIDFLSNEEVREALHQFEIGLLPVGFPTNQRARPKRWKRSIYPTTMLRQSRLR